MTHQNCRGRSTIVFSVGLALMFAGIWPMERGQYPVLMVALFAISGLILLLGLYITLHFWKCPYCGRRFPLRAAVLTHCPRCYRKLSK